MSNDATDEFIKNKVQPAHLPIVAYLRDLMKEVAPEAVEFTAYGTPLIWKVKKSIAVISPSKTHITFAFDRGAEFTDSYGLLEGEGKKTRHVKIKKLEAVNEEALRDYIRQAVALDKG